MTAIRVCLKRVFYNCKQMSTFIEQFNPVTGKLEWKIEREDYDYQQEVARSAYADMLHDWERNCKYHKALKSAIDDLRKANKPVRVLDIGTGSGLLAMMAAKYGADSVYACEAFKPVAECAKNVIADNKLQDKIILIQKRSTDLTLGPNGDLPERANLLVTEVFDTELIGEGALTTFRHALKQLLTEDCIVIPSSAKVYVQVVQSSNVLAWHHLKDFELPVIGKLSCPEQVKNCAGAPAVHDIQMSQLTEDEFVAVTEPVEVKEFNFTDKNKLKFSESSFVSVKAINAGKTELVFMWWDVEMYPGGEILSCAPKWAHPNGPDNIPWRDHWMQAVYYIPESISVNAQDEFLVGTHHDEYSFWFTAHNNITELKSVPAPVCTCGVHINNSRTRMAMMNDHERYGAYVAALNEIESRENKVVIICGETVPLVLIACKLGFKHIFILQSNSYKVDVINNFANANKFQDRITVITKNAEDIKKSDLNNCSVDVLLAEPFFASSVLQWDNIHFWYICASLKDHLDANVRIIPSRAVIYGVAVEFSDLWKIRAPIESTEGFNLASFDRVIQSAINEADFPVEPQPLWEYPSIPMTEKFELCAFNFYHPVQESAFDISGTVDFIDDGKCNGVALWVEFVLDEKRVVSLGPLRSLEKSQRISWYKYCQQGVHIFPYPEAVSHKLLHFVSNFSPQNGNLSFNFKVTEP